VLSDVREAVEDCEERQAALSSPTNCRQPAALPAGDTEHG